MSQLVQKACFGAGCFWGTEKFFRKQFASAILKSKVGYVGGHAASPSYQMVCTGSTGHAEALYLEFDANKVQYADLVHFFFRMHDPTTPNRQGNDKGTQYRSVIFYCDEDQKKVALEVMEAVKGKWPNPIVTTLEPFTNFYDAENYHQMYLENNPNGYCNHRLHW